MARRRSANGGMDELETAIEKQSGELEEAQRQLVLSQFSTYKWNKERMSDIEAQLETIEKDLEGDQLDDPKMFKLRLAKRKALTAERNQLTTANNSISSKLFMQLRGTGGEADELDEFFMKESGNGR